jgi:hypothetical protein
LGLTANVWVHERARKIEAYNQPILCPALGKSKEGREIPVNSVGRWLFGVPGYGGNVRIYADGDTVTMCYSQDAPQLVHDLVQAIKDRIEQETELAREGHLRIYDRTGDKWFDVWWLLYDRSTGMYSFEHRWNHDVYNYEEEYESLNVDEAMKKVPEEVRKRVRQLIDIDTGNA